MAGVMESLLLLSLLVLATSQTKGRVASEDAPPDFLPSLIAAGSHYEVGQQIVSKNVHGSIYKFSSVGEAIEIPVPPPTVLYIGGDLSTRSESMLKNIFGGGGGGGGSQSV